MNLLDFILSGDIEINLADKKLDVQTKQLLGEVLFELRKRFETTPEESEALSKVLRVAINNSEESSNRNDIFKAAHALKIKLPSSSF